MPVPDQHTELSLLRPRVPVAVGLVRREAQGVAGPEPVGLPRQADLRLPGEDGHILLRPRQMGLGLQCAAGEHHDPIGLEPPLPVKGEGRAVPVPPPILLQNRRVIAPQQHRPLPGRLHQRGERHLVTVGDLPHHGDGGVHVPLLDLGQHTAGHPRQPGGLVQRQPLLLPEPPGVLRHHCVDLQTFLPSLLTRY